jgi:hypothetical protein
LAGFAQLHADGNIDGADCYDITTDGTWLYLINNANTTLASVFKYTKALAYVSEFGTFGTGDKQFDAPRGIVTDGNFLYIADTGNHRIQKIRCIGEAYISQVGSMGDGDDNFTNPWGLCVGNIMDLVVAHASVLELAETLVEPTETVAFLVWSDHLNAGEECLLVARSDNHLYLLAPSNPAGRWETRDIDFGVPGVDKTLDRIVFWGKPTTPIDITVWVSLDGGVTWIWSETVTLDRTRSAIVHPWLSGEQFRIRFSAAGLQLSGYQADAAPRGREGPNP